MFIRNRHPLDDVMENNVFAPPTASTFKRSITKLASYEHSDLEKDSVIVHKSITGSYHWKKTVEK